MNTEFPPVEIQNLSLCLNEKWIHHDINLTVSRGEILAIVGKSGSGKTTLLRQILQLQKPTTGTVKIYGIDVFHAKEKELYDIQKNWGVVFQRDALFSSLTTIENVAFPMRHYTDLDETIINELAMLKIKLVGLPEDAAWKYPSELSGGMQKRTATARACIMDPILLFLDEPTAGLDADAAYAFDELILKLKKGLNLTVVIVTHDIDTLWHIADKVAFLGEGSIIGLDNMQNLVNNKNPLIQEYFNNPRSRAAAEEYIDKK